MAVPWRSGTEATTPGTRPTLSAIRESVAGSVVDGNGNCR